MLVVSDTGPVISLATLRRLDLLDAIFDDVVIPEAVWRELEEVNADQMLVEDKDARQYAELLLIPDIPSNARTARTLRPPHWIAIRPVL